MPHDRQYIDTAGVGRAALSACLPHVSIADRVRIPHIPPENLYWFL